MTTVAWDIASPQDYLESTPGDSLFMTFAYTTLDVCDRDFFVRCGAASTLVTVAGAVIAFRVDLAALQCGADVEFSPGAPPGPAYRSLGNPDGLAPPLAGLSLPIMTPEKPATLMMTDFSTAPAQKRVGKPAAKGTPPHHMFAARGIQVCGWSPADNCYHVYHLENESLLKSFKINVKPQMIEAQRHHADLGHGEPHLALSSGHAVLAAATLKLEKDGASTQYKLATPHNAYVRVNDAWQKIDGGRGNELVMQQANDIVIKGFQAPDASPACTDAAARPTETLSFAAAVLDVGETPRYEETMLALATAHVMTS